MDPQVPASFIPKKPLDGGSRLSRDGSPFASLSFLIAFLLLVASVIAAGSAFAYQGYLTQNIASQSASLTAAQGAFDPSTIQALVRLDSRINSAEVLLQKHVAASAIFDFLSLQTLQKVQFTSFDYVLGDDGSASITLAGLADSFSTVALQSDQFGASKVLRDVVFSGISVDSATGHVAFNVKATVDPSLINYGKNLGTTGEAPQAPAAPQATSTAQ